MVAQFGAWSAIVSVGGEMFQASNNLKLFDMPTADCAQHMFWRGRGDVPGEQQLEAV